MAERNRRRHARVKLKQVSTRLKAKDALHIGLLVENMSLGGCFVRCPTPLRKGVEVTLEVMRPGASHPIPVAGKVVSSFPAAPGQTAGMGIAFYPMPREVKARIEGLVAAVSPLAVRANVEPSQAVTDPAMLAVGSVPGNPPAAEAMNLRSQVAAMTMQLKKKDERIAELEAKVEALKQRLILYGGKL